MNGGKLPGHRQTEELMERRFWQYGEKVAFLAADPHLFLKVILKHHGIGQCWKAESFA